MNTKFLDRILLFLLILLLVAGAGLLSSCRSVKKTQHNENTTVHASSVDSSSHYVSRVIDTTETSDMTTITETTIEADSIEFFEPEEADHIGFSSGLQEGSGPTNTRIGSKGIKSAKGVKIKAKVTETAKAEKKGQTAEQSGSSQVIKKDTAAAKAVADNSKKATGFNWWLLLWLIPIVMGLAYWKRGWLIDKGIKLLT